MGKWHLGGAPYYPQHQGFDRNVAGNHMGHPRHGYFSPYKLEHLTDGPKGEYLTDRLTDESCALLEAMKDDPFLLYLAYYTVHTPLQGRKDLVAYYEKKAAALPPYPGEKFLPEGRRKARQVQDHATYAAMVHCMDENIGRLMKKLDALGLTENTAIVFMSDNGGLSTSEGRPTSNLPLRAGKGWLYEGGIREPMFIVWPGVTRPGSTCSEVVTSTDFYPTLLEMTGLPSRPEQHRDGVSLVSLLKGEGSLTRKAVYWHYPHYSNQGGRPGGAVRSGDWKLIENFEDGSVELYDLTKDLGEAHDLAAAKPEKAAELKSLLATWRRTVKARMPTPNPENEK